jgi:hypothetical protein
MLVIEFPTSPPAPSGAPFGASTAAPSGAKSWTLDDVAVLFRSLRNMPAINHFITHTYNPKHPDAPLALIDLREIVRLIDLKNQHCAQTSAASASEAA